MSSSKNKDIIDHWRKTGQVLESHTGTKSKLTKARGWLGKSVYIVERRAASGNLWIGLYSRKADAVAEYWDFVDPALNFGKRA